MITVMEVIARMNVGGPAVIVANLVRGLDADEFDVVAVCGHVGEAEADFLALRDPNLPVTRVAHLGRSIRAAGDLRAFIALVRLMRRERPDVVHTHTAKAGVLGRLAAIVARVPVRVHTFHGHVLHGYFPGWATRLVVFVERILATRTTAIVAVGGRVRDELLAAKIGRSRQYHVVAPGAAMPNLPTRQAARADLQLGDDTPVVVFAGRLTRIKRPDRLVAAMRLVLAEMPDAVLVIAGGGELLDSTRESAADLGDHVVFLGWRDDLSPVYAAGDVAVLTSDNEGMPVTLIEASMADLPCVTTDAGSAGEVVLDGVTGLVVAQSAEAVAAGIVDLLRHPERRAEMGEAAMAHARTAFSVQKAVGAHAALYRRLVAASRGLDESGELVPA
jgi:glycosyltransferase involved in cell wall biosynthesis